MKNIVEIVSEDDGFQTLAAAIRAAGLTEILQTKGPFTLFAPTDAAFARLTKGTLSALLREPRRLADVLLYHVVPATMLSADMISNRRTRPATLNGTTVDIELQGGGLHVNGSTLTERDVLGSNGVVHVIDGVLLPLPVVVR